MTTSRAPGEPDHPIFATGLDPHKQESTFEVSVRMPKHTDILAGLNLLNTQIARIDEVFA